MPLGPFAAATDASPAIRHAGTLLKSGARQCLLALVLSLFTPAAPAHAAQFTVTNLTDSGTGSLRQAITNANAAAGADTITFSVSGTITLGSQLPDITVAGGALTIDGAGRTVTISGNNAVRVMQVVVGTSLTLNNLTIANGVATGNYGGGIYNSGTLTVTNSTFSGNSATGGYGGAINNNTGTLTITNSTFSGNSANQGFGGGIYDSGTATITNSTFSGNRATDGAGAGIANNSVTGVTVRNTIVANSVGAGDCYGTITNGGNNIDDDATCGWGAVSGSMSITNPLLGALANNGGSTPTFALLTGSPAIDGVTFSAPNSAPSTDQRGVARPQGVRYDIGAFEGSETQAGPAFIVNASADTTDGFCDILGQGIFNKDCTLREAINAANALAGANTITFSVSGTITLASTLPTITDTAGLTMNGAGQTLTISGNNAVQVMWVGTGASLTLNNLTIANGIAAGQGGGGILNNGTATITNSTFSGNSAGNTSGFGGFGGAILNGSGPLTITNSTFSGNSSTGGGGAGIFASGTLTITNSTFSGNSSTGGGGGGIFANNATVTITNSTFSGNSASAGAGIYRGGGTVTLRNTIVANSVGAGNCGSGITNGGNNIDSGITCGWGAASGSMSSTNPLLGALANNGGRTQTLAPLPGSPAIDGVTFSAPNSAPSTDQRGLARPRGVRYDIGSYETQFTDDPLTAGITTVKAVHITELRIRIDAVRIAKGLLAYEWADPSLGPNGWLIRAQHIIDLRTALGQAYVQAGLTAPTYATDPPPSLAPGVVVKAAHIAEIRTALVAIE